MPVRRRYAVPLPGGVVLDLGTRPLLMGVLNVTPDSFAEQRPLVTGDAIDAARACELALAMEADGADLLDIGGESTRPGAGAVSAEEEMARVLAVIQPLAHRLRIPLSVDTSKASVARAALAEGATIVNDISALQYDPGMAGVVAEGKAAVILMHMRGRPQTMYEGAAYGDVVTEVIDELRARLDAASAAGIPAERQIVDPGIGFAKRAEHSYGVLAALETIQTALDRPLLVGPSRKSFLTDAVGNLPAGERDWATAAAVTAAVLAGAHIIRVHAVKEMAQVIRVAERIRQARENQGK